MRLELLPRARSVAACAVIGVLVCGGLAGTSAAADDVPVPTRQQVQEAQDAAAAGARDVAAVQADLAAANAEVERASVRAAQAAEAFNGARYEAGLARDAADAARTAQVAADAEVERLRVVYGRAVVSRYTNGSDLAALSAVTEAEGVESLLDRLSTARLGAQALQAQQDGLLAAQDDAALAADDAEQAEQDAEAALTRSREAQAEAQAAQDDAAAQAQAVAVRKAALLDELARLQGVSVAIAERRQAGLEQRAAEAAAAEAERERREERRAQQAAAAAAAAAEPEEAAPPASPDPQPAADPEPAADPAPDPEPAPAPDPAPDPEPAPAPAPAPAPNGGAQAAIAFARAQLGEPYVWAAAGPGAWDCSGLTMQAWAAGGVSLPHYSVAQYEQATPVASSDLRPGDLLFWGSSSSPSSIYHVALYVGDGMMIHAPRAGRPVVEESMYYWITPNFRARP
ncbi:C40 family peptidase [Nocardioides dongxiaopingii]|uniref:C40 family peptidase n=1 Tax=Nocardioides dongxiaopingii TaxID=2576036 RepID=UPI0010C76915|nr:C40 family peptidase [Nocardioides dongxiaopingii]